MPLPTLSTDVVFPRNINTGSLVNCFRLVFSKKKKIIRSRLTMRSTMTMITMKKWSTMTTTTTRTTMMMMMMMILTIMMMIMTERSNHHLPAVNVVCHGGSQTTIKYSFPRTEGIVPSLSSQRLEQFFHVQIANREFVL